MNITEKLILGALALLGAVYHPGYAQAKDLPRSIPDIIAQHLPEQPSARTVAVFQKEDGTPCRIREQDTTLSVECYVRGGWQIRRAQVSRVSATTKPAPKRAVVTPLLDVDVRRDAQAAAKVAQEVRFAIAFN